MNCRNIRQSEAITKRIRKPKIKSLPLQFCDETKLNWQGFSSSADITG